MTPDLLAKIVSRCCQAASRLCMFQLQDLLDLDRELWSQDPRGDRINVPGTVTAENWTWRMPLSVEELGARAALSTRIRALADGAPRAGCERGRVMADPGPTYHFHISRAARARYGFSRDISTRTGNVVFLDLHAARLFTQRVNEVRKAQGAKPEESLRAGEMNAMALIDEILHYVAALYRKRVDRTVVARALSFAEERLGAAAVAAAQERFAEEFPAPPLIDGKMSAAEYLAEDESGTPRREIALEEMLLLSLANANPAFRPFSELFDHAVLVSGDLLHRPHGNHRRVLPGRARLRAGPPGPRRPCWAARCGRRRNPWRDSSSTSAPGGARSSGTSCSGFSPGSTSSGKRRSSVSAVSPPAPRRSTST